MRWRFSVQTRRVWAIAATLGMVLALPGCAVPEKPAVYQDQLGPEAGESVADYIARTPFARPAVTSWALVTFTSPVSLADAAAFADDHPSQRVNQLVFADRAPATVPEPGRYATREDLFRIYGDIAGADTVTGLVVFASPDSLVAMNDDPPTMHVEVLPTDATWGFIGVRPVQLDG